MAPTDPDVRLCREQAEFYRLRGFNPLPSRPDDKRPMLKYADMWSACLLPRVFDRFATSNIQIMTGRAWGLLVIDLDGPEAVEKWETMGPCPRTWVSHSGGGGRHVWFTIPTSGPSLPKAVLWKGDGKHSAIERLCDQSLVMAPPSIHPKTGRRYRWLGKHNSPIVVPMPAPCPSWVLQLAPVAAERPLVAVHPAPPTSASRRTAAGRVTGPRMSWRETIESIPDIPSLVRSWGLRTVGSPRQSGWLPCHAFDRDDAHPSAAIHSQSGYYVDRGSGLRLRLADLAVALRIYSSPQEAINDLGGRYGRCG
jgi:hypothetical protein